MKALNIRMHVRLGGWLTNLKRKVRRDQGPFHTFFTNSRSVRRAIGGYEGPRGGRPTPGPRAVTVAAPRSGEAISCAPDHRAQLFTRTALIAENAVTVPPIAPETRRTQRVESQRQPTC